MSRPYIVLREEWGILSDSVLDDVVLWAPDSGRRVAGPLTEWALHGKRAESKSAVVEPKNLAPSDARYRESRG